MFARCGFSSDYPDLGDAEFGFSLKSLGKQVKYAVIPGSREAEDAKDQARLLEKQLAAEALIPVNLVTPALVGAGVGIFLAFVL